MKRALAPDLAAALTGATLVSGHRLLAATAFTVALMGSRRKVRSTTVEGARLAQRLAAVSFAAAVVAPPISAWWLGVAVTCTVATALRRLTDILHAQPARAWRRGLATVLVGDEDDVRTAARLFASHPEEGVRPVATATTGGVPTVLPNGAIDDLRELIVDHNAAHVLVVTPSFGCAVEAILGRTRPFGVRVSVLPPMAETLTSGAEVVEVRGMPFLSLAPRRRPAGFQWALKRSIDFALALIGLVVALPVFLIAAVAIQIEGGGPVFYRQKRVGRDGKLFDLWKFRSMVVDADVMVASLSDLNEAAAPYFKIENDPRVTRVGRLLRRLSIDELPQLFNVLRGDMSLVGPRPFLPSEMQEDPDTFGWRLWFYPGITGLWQVAGRSWLPLSEGVRMDLTYVENWSLGLDLRILLRTLSAALRGDRRPPVIGPKETPSLSPRRYLALVEGDDLRSADNAPDVSIVIVTHQSARDIGPCLDSLHALDDAASREIIVVDNASTDGTAAIVATYPHVRLIRKRRRDGFAVNVNVGAVASAGRHLLLLNPDTVVSSGSVDRLVDHLDAHPEVGAVGPRLIYPDGTHQPSARRFPTPVNTIVRRTPLRRLLRSTAGTARHLMEDQRLENVMDVDWLLGAVVAVRGDAFREVGGLDDGYRLYCEDIDLCWRMHTAGWRVQYLTTTTVQHSLGELTAKRFFTRRTLWHFRSMARFVRLHGLQPPAHASLPTVVRRRPISRIDLLDRPVLAADHAA